MTIRRFLILFFAASVLFGAHIAAAAEKQPEKTEASQPADYVIGPEDVLEISVWKNADLSKVVSVRPDGKISLPLIGDIQAAGLTPEQLKDNVEKKVKEFQNTAIVSVILQSINSYKVFIIGEVKAPGSYSLKSNTTILQALAIAGGFTQFASKNDIILIRKGKTGGEEKVNVRLKDLVFSGDNINRNFTLKPGDTIFVP